MTCCVIPECQKPAHAKGWCSGHYMKQHRYGDPLTPDRPRGSSRPVPLVDRLVHRWDVDSNGCWLWNGDKRNGYGSVWVDGRRVYAHRAIYELHHGPLAADMVVRHQCDVRACVNPEHLLSGTKADNQRDMSERARWRNQYKMGAGHPSLRSVS